MAIPQHVSFSQLSTWLYCGKQLFLERVAEVPSVPGWFSVAGSAFHEWTEEFDQLDGEPLSWAEVFDKAINDEERNTGIDRSVWRKAGVTKANPDGQTYAHWLAKGEELTDLYINWAMEQPLPLYVEKDVSVELIPGVMLRGMIDRVYPEAIIDIKTSTAQPKQGEMQIGVYRAALMALEGDAPNWGGYYMAKDGKVPKLYDLTRWTPEYAGALLKQYMDAVKAEVFIPLPSFSCNACPVKQACYAANGAEAYKYDPLHPNYGGSNV